MAGAELVSVKDYELKAHSLLSKPVADFISGGAGDEETLRDNTEDFKLLRFRPQMLMNASNTKLSTTLLGQKIDFPVCIGPTSIHMLAHPEGEIATGKAAEALGTCMCMSTMSNTSITELADKVPNLLKWFQLYICKDPEVTKELVRRAERAGCKAIVVTVDTLETGNRRRNVRNGFKLPPHLQFKNFEGMIRTDGKGYLAELHELLDTSLTWEGVKWITSITHLPVVAKGILTGTDAKKALNAGCRGIYVSNHGGRQLDHVSSSIMALPEVVEAVDGKAEVYMDGGIRGGTDVLMALALGARAVFVGRPALYGLAVGGEKGVKDVLTIIKKEMELSMKLSGVADVERIPKDFVRFKGLAKL